MIKSPTRFVLPLVLPALFLSLSVSFPVFAKETSESSTSGFHGAEYQADIRNTSDFRNISTLNDFDLMVSHDRWSGINAADVLVEFKKFDGIQGSPAMREIWHNVLLGDFSGLNVRNGQEQAMLMAERIRLLNRLGYFDDAVRLYLQASQHKPIPEALALQGIDALALSGSADGACLETLMASQHLKGDIWNQDAALCNAYFGEAAKADEAMKNSGDASDGFREVYKMLRGNETKAIHVNIPPLWRTLLLAKGAGVPNELIEQSDAVTLSALAQSDKVSLPLRLAAASRAADRGTIGVDKLRKLYEMKNTTPESVINFVPLAQNGGADLPQSDIYGAARFTFEGNARAAIVRSAMQKLHPLTNIKGQVYGWIVDKLTLQVDKLGWFAPYGFALMTETNRRASADMYYETGHLGQSSLSVVYAILEQKPWSKSDQTAWQNAMQAAGKKDKVTKAFSIAKAFDQEDKLALNENAIIKTDESKSTGILQESIRKGGRGLTLIAALNRLASAKQINQLSTSETSEIIAVLGKQGLFGERKKIALEILLQTVL